MTTLNELVARAVAQRIARTAQVDGAKAAADYEQHIGALNEAACAWFDQMILDFAIELADKPHASENSVQAVDLDSETVS